MTQDENNNSQEKKDAVVLTRSDKALIAIALIAIIVVFGLYLLYYPNRISTDHSSWGQFGDYFGGVLNPILGFFTVLLLIITLRISYQTLKVSKDELEKATDMLGLAKDEIKLTQEALEQSKEEVRQAKEATEKQVEHLKDEAFKSELSNIIKEVDSEIQDILKIRAASQGAFLYGYYLSANSDSAQLEQFFKNYNGIPNDKYYVDKLYKSFVALDEFLASYHHSFPVSAFSQRYQTKYLEALQIINEYDPKNSPNLEILGRQQVLL